MPRPKRTPLEYMLWILNDPTVDGDRRDRMAVAAAPYCHPRIIGKARGKKQRDTEAANKAVLTPPPKSGWAEDLSFQVTAN